MGMSNKTVAGIAFLTACIAVLLGCFLSFRGYRGHQHVVGIDLGTTFSVIAVKDGGKVRVIPNYETGKLLTPSVVYFPSRAVNAVAVVGDR